LQLIKLPKVDTLKTAFETKEEYHSKNYKGLVERLQTPCRKITSAL